MGLSDYTKGVKTISRATKRITNSTIKIGGKVYRLGKKYPRATLITAGTAAYANSDLNDYPDDVRIKMMLENKRKGNRYGDK